MNGLSKAQIRRLALICAAVALAVVLIVLIIVFATRESHEEPNQPQGENTRVIPEGMRLIEDIYNGEMIVPDFDVPENKYDPKGFSTGEDGLKRYKEASIGIDISEFQRDIDWYAVKAAGIDFAIIRVGYRGMTQGLLTEDSKFQENFQQAEAAEIKRGVYFFSQAVTEDEAEEEAEYVLEKLDGAKLEYPIVFDWEDPVPSEDLPANTLRALDCSGDTVSKCAQAFCQRIKKAGYIPCVYFNKNQAYNFYDLEMLKDFDFWYADYNPLPAVCYHFRMWQYSESGTVPGIETTVDLDLCFQPY
ncbi:lysozyme [Acutalibacter sp. 1XD8-33]|uniref:glycoside hydrolase family 25 protein n=1 Tax=Acutalibacter sp. 1XD8-33 TaxID=2320081 RepID=UPI000EA255A2|nr:glycoside hydrolase family 25 protein [Acutalibacter sp. 1XD8-33]RKJ39978.1 lysozyme [Acutalibacter sp. 1XD8-33]